MHKKIIYKLQINLNNILDQKTNQRFGWTEMKCMLEIFFSFIDLSRAQRSIIKKHAKEQSVEATCQYKNENSQKTKTIMKKNKIKFDDNIFKREFKSDIQLEKGEESCKKLEFDILELKVKLNLTKNDIVDLLKVLENEFSKKFEFFIKLSKEEGIDILKVLENEFPDPFKVNSLKVLENDKNK